MSKNVILVTNNPMAAEKLSSRIRVVTVEGSYTDTLKAIRDRVHQGAVILTHPMYGSVKPGETPYRSVIVKDSRGPVDPESLRLIEEALTAAAKFKQRTDVFRPEAIKDFQFVDYSLILSGIEAYEAK